MTAAERDGKSVGRAEGEDEAAPPQERGKHETTPPRRLGATPPPVS
ncbi:MAG: hypothetical protein LBH64_03765 [Coriobacteriales bacterium]|nr:hypothetical protein [Coriobacteriales bacterium]